MNMGGFLTFLVAYNEAVIQWLIFAIVAMVAFLLGRALFSPERSSGSSAGQSAFAPEAEAKLSALAAEDLEDRLKKVLEQHQQGTESAASAPGQSPQSASGGDSVGGSGLAELKLELSQKQQEIEDLKAQLTAVPSVSSEGSEGGAADGRNSELLTKIKELETRLAEYEILEDDIADLSMYKEENNRLRQELERQAQSPAAYSAVESGEADASLEQTMVSESIDAAAAEVTVDVTADEAGADKPASDKVFADAEAVSTEETEEEVVPVASVQESIEPVEGDDDLLAEFSRAIVGEEKAETQVKASAPIPEPESTADAKVPVAGAEAEAEGFDASKMLEEMEALSQVALSSPEEESGSIFEESLDTDKMEKEASKLVSNE